MLSQPPHTYAKSCLAQAVEGAPSQHTIPTGPTMQNHVPGPGHLPPVLSAAHQAVAPAHAPAPDPGPAPGPAPSPAPQEEFKGSPFSVSQALCNYYRLSGGMIAGGIQTSWHQILQMPVAPITAGTIMWHRILHDAKDTIFEKLMLLMHKYMHTRCLLPTGTIPPLPYPQRQSEPCSMPGHCAIRHCHSCNSWPPYPPVVTCA